MELEEYSAALVIPPIWFHFVEPIAPVNPLLESGSVREWVGVALNTGFYDPGNSGINKGINLGSAKAQLTVGAERQSNSALRSLEDDFGFGRFTRHRLDDLIDQIGVGKFGRLENLVDLLY